MLDHVLASELTTLPPGFEDEAYKAAHEESNRDWKDFVRGAKWAVKRLLKA